MISFIHIAKITIQARESNIDYANKYPNVTSSVKNVLYFASSEASARLQFQPTADVLFQALLEREEQQSTELGLSIAIPHGRLAEIDMPIVVFYVLEQPLLFKEEMVQIIPCLWIPSSQPELHLAYLSELVTHLSDDEKRSQILACVTDAQLQQCVEDFYQ